MMYGNLIVPILISFIILIKGQYDDERDLPSEISQPIRNSKSSFDAQFHRGLCPDRFYQVGDECLYFATDGERYSWHQAQRVCARRIARQLQRQTSFVVDQSKMKPTKGVRQLILNTPEKTKILEALYREYDELHIAVRLPSDFNTLHRCRGGKEDNWPQYCTTPENPNATCFDTSELGSNHICLRQIQCHQRNSRLACEFTLPGSPELTASKFRHCPKSRGFRHRLTLWAWILVAVGAMLLLLLILGGVLAFMRNSKRGSAEIQKPESERRGTDEQAKNISSTSKDPAAEPMLVRATPANVSDTGYLEPQPIKRVVPPTTITTATVKQNNATPNV